MSKNPAIATGGGLRANALGTFDSVVMAIAGCGPAYSMATQIPVLIAAVGVGAPAVLLYCAIPMVGIALAYRHLGRLDANAGAGYTWLARTLHPFLGFLSGWALVVAAVVFLVSTTLPVGDATLWLLGVDAADHTTLATATGAGWFVLMALVVLLGARISAHAQTVITCVQVVLLVAFAGAALALNGEGPTRFSLSWFGLGATGGGSGFASGALIAVVSFWGWDVTSNLGEETRDSNRTAGLGGLIGVVVSFALFAAFAVAGNTVLGAQAVRNNPSGFLTSLGEAVIPGGGGRVLMLAVLLSTVATLETTLIQATRTLFAMGRDRTMPSGFGRIHRTRQTPWPATLAVAALALLLLVGSQLSGSGPRLLADAVNGVGLLVAFYYGLAGLAAVVVYRRQLFRSVGNLLLLGLWPLLGSAFMVWIFAVSVTELDGDTLAIGLGALAAGVLPMLATRRRAGSYHRPVRLDPEQVRMVADRYQGSNAGAVTVAAGHWDEAPTNF